MTPVETSRALARAVAPLRFGPPVAFVYNPLEYAWEAHKQYLERYGMGPREALLLGMNPGPWGMAQTGIPFGEVAAVRDWLRIDAPIGRPAREHPKRPVLGLACRRSEVSGARLWGWARERFGTPERFFTRFLILNYCPLSFMEEGGRNLTPDKLPERERAPLLAACDEALVRLVAYYRPRWVIGIGAFAEKRARAALAGGPARVGAILHPSPASPAANGGWSRIAAGQLEALGVL